MLDNLTQRLARVVKTMRGEARLTEANTAEMLREVRLALLEADVALPVVREFIARVKEKALGEDVISSLSPGQALVGIVQRELTAIIGGEEAVAAAAPGPAGVPAGLPMGRAAELNLNVQPPAIILMAGLQGAGKTTTVGKLAKWLKENKKKKVLTVSCDVYRPAAIAQLKTVSEQVGADFFPSQPEQKPVDIAAAALDWAKKHYHDVLIVDTAGRLGIDEAMMQEIAALHAALKPAETLFVVDAMLGQDAVNTAKAFNDALPLTGVVLTKLDGDARGGAALSVRHITGKPIKFVGVAEKLDGLEPFYPDRMAQRILGMGDILALVEEAQRGVDMEQAQKLAAKIKKTGGFDLEDFKAQIGQMKKMGGLGGLMDKLPAQFAQQAQGANMDQAEKQVRRMEGIINSMTPAERAKPELIKASRKRRIAAGAGVPVQEVNRLLNQFEQMQTMMKKLKGGGMMKMMRAMGGLKGGMKGLLPGGR
ncbi:signal recognition particle protein [Ralstonia syzygii subsp. celebesensis]|uniref:Signal recognition particle protein n=3 Tax=Ralstonia solanacearum species complex TaxID=3116862 RepID=A0AAD0S7D9_RALSL|nr:MULTISPECIES: signal recognition particle protein [Ralstonia solanacearum species complex]CCA81507.1 signal recognition particle (SRP) component with 4.5S RNA (ffs) [blood disease bacterium R229]AQW30863.1 signal recognition particle protein [blood disease bacterium A2-HR MARDI]AXV80575.1 signal recognition particle protein [Ralstonia solanacearum]AXW51724.1 signal recognition particle protein [Ralstonia solanacearum]QQV55326.1 signal recognition particle protein [Ralstonia syzygii subsp. c